MYYEKVKNICHTGVNAYVTSSQVSLQVSLLTRMAFRGAVDFLMFCGLFTEKTKAHKSWIWG